MSDTDDTDVLLLIPPNFFLVESSESEDSLLKSSRTVVHKPLSCTAQVLDKLVTQVHTLESRLENLEISSDISTIESRSKRNTTWISTDSFDSRSLNRNCFTFPRRRRRKVPKRGRQRERSLTSLDSINSAGRNVPPLKLTTESTPDVKYLDIHEIQSMDGDISSIVSTPSKTNDKLLLNEIDEFLTKVESYESPESKYKSHEMTLCTENVIKATSDYLSQKLDSNEEIKLPSGRVVSSSVLDKYIYLVKNNLPTNSEQSPSSSKNTVKSYENSNTTNEVSNTVQTKSPSARKLNFDKEFQPTSTPNKQQTTYNSFQPSSNKIYDRASRVLEQYKASYSKNKPGATDSYSASSNQELKLPEMRPFGENRESLKFIQNKYIDTIDSDLLSLSELWGDKAERTTGYNRGDKVDIIKLEEERLKREHCEAMIQQLQKKLLDQQEKLAVAMKVDRAKDAAISKLREAWLRLTNSLDRAEDRHRKALEKMICEVENFRVVADDAQKKTSHFESELYKTLDLAHDYQDKCKQLQNEKKSLEEQLNTELDNVNVVLGNKDKEIEVLKENYDTVMRLNKQLTDCVKNLEEALEKEKLAHDSTKSTITELNNRIQSVNDETLLLTQERDLLKSKVNEERSRCAVIEQQLCEKQNQCSEVLKKCDFLDNEVKTLRQHLELQKNELKCHYQKQLEDAVLAKLQEFQEQLDRAEREMENDARLKENNIVDSFNKQILRIEEQHKLEINVLEEKQREEIKLYRLQLAQAAEKLGLLESKVECQRRRRGETAARLHAALQAHWRHALRILAAPHHDLASTPLPQDVIPPLSMSSVTDRGLARQKDPPTRKHSDEFNFEGLSEEELQHYIKMLLVKPPSAEEAPPPAPPADEEQPTSDRPERLDRRDRSAKRCLGNKPPWKA